MADGDPSNWRQIVDLHGARVLGVANRILGSIHDAEDVSQEVFAEAYRLHLTNPVRSWAGLLVRLATLRAIDRLRRDRQAEGLHEHQPIDLVEPIHEASARELAEWLRAAITRLPKQQATVFVLLQFGDLSRDEVSEDLGISPEAVSTALYKARHQLMSQLAVFSERDSQ